jgi:hypothetical protein
MREKGSVIAFCAVTAAMGATVFASSSAGAVPLAGYSGLNSAVRQAIPTQEARYICRGSRRHRCYYVSRPARPHFNGYYYGSNWGGMYPGEAEYNVHYWGSGANKF